MPHGESRDSGGDRGEPEPQPGASGLSGSETGLETAGSHDAPHQLIDSTSQLVAMLQLRIDLLRKTGDPKVSEIAGQLEEQLAEIRREIGRSGEDEPETGAG